MRGLVQAPVPGAQGLDKITRFRERDPLLQRDVDVAAAVGGVVLNPPGPAVVQPGLDGADVGLTQSMPATEESKSRKIAAQVPSLPKIRTAAGNVGSASVRARSCFCGYDLPASRDKRTRG